MNSIVSRTRRAFLAALGATLGASDAFASADVLTPDRPPARSRYASQSSPAEYLFARGLTYLNTASLGPAPREVLESTLQAWRQLEANPVVMSYGEGAVHVATDRARQAAAAFLGCDSDHLLITRSTTDAMNHVALGMRLTRGDRVLTTDQEHHGGGDCWRYLAARRGVVVDTVPIAHADHHPGAIVERFAGAITRQTRVISVSHVLTSTGLRMPVAELAALARERGVLCVVDGAQAVGQIAVDVGALRCHAYAASGHKWLMGPKGTGLLYVSPDAADEIAPIQWQSGSRRFVAESSGIGSLPLVVGLGAAVETMKARGMAAVERRVLGLRDYAVRQLGQVPRVRVVSAPSGPMASALVAVALPSEIESRGLQTTLRDKYNIIVKQVEKQWFNGIRISPHIFNTEADIDRAMKALRAELA